MLKLHLIFRMRWVGHGTGDEATKKDYLPLALVTRRVPGIFTSAGASPYKFREYLLLYTYFRNLASLCPTNTKYLMVMKCILLPPPLLIGLKYWQRTTTNTSAGARLQSILR